MGWTITRGGSAPKPIIGAEYTDYLDSVQRVIEEEQAAGAPALYDQTTGKFSVNADDELEPKQTAPSVRRRNRKGKKDLIIKANPQVNAPMGTPGGGSGLGIPSI